MYKYWNVWPKVDSWELIVQHGIKQHLLSLACRSLPIDCACSFFPEAYSLLFIVIIVLCSTIMSVSCSSTPYSDPLDKIYGITNIKSYISLLLDLDRLNYDSWKELFKTHFIGYSVYDHLDGSSSASSK